MLRRAASRRKVLPRASPSPKTRRAVAPGRVARRWQWPGSSTLDYIMLAMIAALAALAAAAWLVGGPLHEEWSRHLRREPPPAMRAIRNAFVVDEMIVDGRAIPPASGARSAGGWSPSAAGACASCAAIAGSRSTGRPEETTSPVKLDLRLLAEEDGANRGALQLVPAAHDPRLPLDQRGALQSVRALARPDRARPPAPARGARPGKVSWAPPRSPLAAFLCRELARTLAIARGAMPS